MVLGGSGSPIDTGTCFRAWGVAVPGPQATLGHSQVRTSQSPRLRHGSSISIVFSSRKQHIKYRKHRFSLPRQRCPGQLVLGCLGLSSELLEPGDLSALLQIPDALVVVLL